MSEKIKGFYEFRDFRLDLVEKVLQRQGKTISLISTQRRRANCRNLSDERKTCVPAKGGELAGNRERSRHLAKQITKRTKKARPRVMWARFFRALYYLVKVNSRFC